MDIVLDEFTGSRQATMDTLLLLEVHVLILLFDDQIIDDLLIGDIKKHLRYLLNALIMGHILLNVVQILIVH